MSEIIEEYNKVEPLAFEKFLIECNFAQLKLINLRKEIDQGIYTEEYFEVVIGRLYAYFRAQKDEKRKRKQSVFAYVYKAIESDFFEIGKTTKKKVLLPDFRQWQEVIDYQRVEGVRPRKATDMRAPEKAIDTTFQDVSNTNPSKEFPPVGFSKLPLNTIFDILSFNREERALIMEYIDMARLKNVLYYIETSYSGSKWKILAKEDLISSATEEKNAKQNSQKTA
jgi:hypothetical protein